MSWWSPLSRVAPAGRSPNALVRPDHYRTEPGRGCANHAASRISARPSPTKCHGLTLDSPTTSRKQPDPAVSAITKLSGEGRAAITLLTTAITLLTMVRTCVSGWTWSSGSKDHSPRPWAGGADGEEDVLRIAVISPATTSPAATMPSRRVIG